MDPLARRAVTAAPERARHLNLGLVVLAAVGAVLLLVVAVNRWATPSDEHAYWLAARRLLDGQPLYDANATPITPYAYWYPPVVAQALVPVAAVMPAPWFTALWTVLLLGCLWWLAGRHVLVALALVAFPPVAVELWFRNVHLVLAVLLVLALRDRPVLFAVGAAIKIGPGLGLAYLAAGARWRALARTVLVGGVILAVSVVLSPQAWWDYLDVLIARGPADVSGFLPVPYAVRALVGLVLAVLAAHLRPPHGPVLLAFAVTAAMPTLWFTALSLLIAVVPLWRGFPRNAERPDRSRPGPSEIAAT